MRVCAPILAMVMASAGAAAQAASVAPSCVAPANLEPAPALTPPANEVVTGVPIAYYVLALSWTPQWCRSGGSGATASEMECERPFGFTLHGLWPDGAHPPYPRFCRPAGRIDAATARSMFCRTPSPVLLQHEWQAHGTCAAWPSAEAYFAQAAALYDRLAMPKIEAIAPERLTAGAIRAAFVAKNPSLTARMVYVQASREGALTEVRVCYDLAFRPTACPGGNGAPDRMRLRLAQSRSGAF